MFPGHYPQGQSIHMSKTKTIAEIIGPLYHVSRPLPPGSIHVHVWYKHYCWNHRPTVPCFQDITPRSIHAHVSFFGGTWFLFYLARDIINNLGYHIWILPWTENVLLQWLSTKFVVQQTAWPVLHLLLSQLRSSSRCLNGKRVTSVDAVLSNWSLSQIRLWGCKNILVFLCQSSPAFLLIFGHLRRNFIHNVFEGCSQLYRDILYLCDYGSRFNMWLFKYFTGSDDLSRAYFRLFIADDSHMDCVVFHGNNTWHHEGLHVCCDPRWWLKQFIIG